MILQCFHVLLKLFLFKVVRLSFNFVNITRFVMMKKLKLNLTSLKMGTRNHWRITTRVEVDGVFLIIIDKCCFLVQPFTIFLFTSFITCFWSILHYYSIHFLLANPAVLVLNEAFLHLLLSRFLRANKSSSEVRKCRAMTLDSLPHCLYGVDFNVV